MAKVTVRGWLQQVGSAAAVGKEQKLMVQQIVFVEPAYRDQFGETKGKDSPWLIEIVGEENIKKFNLTKDNINDKVAIACFINGFVTTPTEEQAKAGKEPFWGYKTVLYDLQSLGKMKEENKS